MITVKSQAKHYQSILCIRSDFCINIFPHICLLYLQIYWLGVSQLTRNVEQRAPSFCLKRQLKV